MSKILALALTALLSGPFMAHAQTRAAVTGVVTDESKAVLPGATVTATELSTGRQYIGVADGRGEYRLDNVAPGTYRVQAELAGFLRLSKEFRLGGDVRLAGIAEVFNLFNHDNFGSYNGVVNTATFGDPRQSTGTGYTPRSGQFAFRLSF